MGIIFPVALLVGEKGIGGLVRVVGKPLTLGCNVSGNIACVATRGSGYDAIPAPL
jgi:hypothetical protein